MRLQRQASRSSLPLSLSLSLKQAQSFAVLVNRWLSIRAACILFRHASFPWVTVEAMGYFYIILMLCARLMLRLCSATSIYIEVIFSTVKDEEEMLFTIDAAGEVPTKYQNRKRTM